MAAKVYTTAGVGQAVDPMQINIKSVLVTGDGGTASATIKDGNGNAVIKVSAPANSSASWPAGLNEGSSVPIVGPVTVDVTGTSPFVRIDY